MRHLAYWHKELGSKRLIDLTPDVIDTAWRKLKKGKTRTGKPRTAGTCNRYLVTLAHCCAQGVQWKWLQSNPARHIDKLGEPKGRTRFLSDSERVSLLEACMASDDPNLYLIAVLALSTGMRAGEIRYLKWKDIELDRRRIVLHDIKNTETRVVPLVGHAFDLMQKHAKVRRIDTPYVFAGRFSDRPASFRRSWEAAVEAAGIDDFRFHDARHTAASYLAMSGASLSELAEILGHRTLVMVKRYSHFTEAHTASVVERMNRQVFGD